VKKDLTFIRDGNDSKIDDLINFEKLRMMAKEIRRICNMSLSFYVSFSAVLTCRVEHQSINQRNDIAVIYSWSCLNSMKLRVELVRRGSY